MIPRGLSYDDAMRQFRWPRPERFNIGRAVCERHPPHALAMIVENGDGSGPQLDLRPAPCRQLAAGQRARRARHHEGRPRRRVPEPERRAHALPPRRLPHGRDRAAAVHAVRRGGGRVPARQRRGLGRHHRHGQPAQGPGGARSPAAPQDDHRDRRRRARPRLPRLGPPARPPRPTASPPSTPRPRIRRC